MTARSVRRSRLRPRGSASTSAHHSSLVGSCGCAQERQSTAARACTMAVTSLATSGRAASSKMKFGDMRPRLKATTEMSLISGLSPDAHSQLLPVVRRPRPLVRSHIREHKMRSNLLQSRPMMERKSSTPSSSSVVSDMRVPQWITSQSSSVERNFLFDLPLTMSGILLSFGRATHPLEKFENHSACESVRRTSCAR